MGNHDPLCSSCGKNDVYNHVCDTIDVVKVETEESEDDRIRKENLATTRKIMILFPQLRGSEQSGFLNTYTGALVIYNPKALLELLDK